MEQRPSHRMTPQLVTGVIIILLGMILLLDRLDVLYAGDFLRFWPALVIVYGLAKMGEEGWGRGRFSGVLIVLIGVLLLLRSMDVISFHLWDYWPVVLIIMGSVLLFRSLARRRDPGVDAGETTSRMNAFVMFGGMTRKNSSKEFTGGELTTIMGGCEIDLRDATIRDGDTVIDALVFLGGIEMKVPEDWTLSIECTPFMGGCEDKTRPPRQGSTKRLVIRGYVIMGGLEIGN